MRDSPAGPPGSPNAPQRPLAALPRPLLLWALALGGLAAGTAVALPWVGPSGDFALGGHVFAHIADRGLTPIPVVQNAPGAWPLLVLYLAAFGLACAAYVAILRLPGLRPAHVWGAFALGAVVMCAVPFFPTTDPYAYALYALEAGPLHLNPYAVQALAPAASSWSGALAAIFPDPGAYVRHCNYGPVAAFAYAALAAPFAHLPLVAFLYVERLFGALCVAATGLALARSAPAGDGARRAAAYVLHPLVLCEFVAFAHGDALMLALLAFAFVAWRRAAFGWAGALCVAALATRSVAALGLVALFVVVARTQPRGLMRVVAGAALAALVIGGASFARFGTVSLGGAPAFNPFSAPFVYVATAFELPHALASGVFIEAAFGAVVILILLRRTWSKPRAGALEWLPFGALAALPAIYPHYLGWVAGVAALRDDSRFVSVARVATFVAPLWYVARLNLFAPPQPSAPAYAALLIVTWGSALFAIVASGGARRAALRLRLRRA